MTLPAADEPATSNAMNHGGIGQPDVDTDAILGDARERALKLLDVLGVQAVISVDDIHFLGNQGSAAEVTEAMAGSVPLQGTVVESLRGDPTAGGFDAIDDEDSSAVADYINENWDGFSADLQQRLLGSSRTVENDREEKVDESEIADDIKSQVTLRGMFDGFIEFLPMSMTDWVAGWRDLMSDGRRYLVLIDRTFSRERDGAEELGDALLAELLSEVGDNVWAGLLTRHAVDERSEHDLTDGLRLKFPEHSHRLAAIGKFRTSNVEFLPAGLRALLLVREIDAYRKLVATAFDHANVAAQAHFANLSNYAIVEAIAAAQQEGSFELDQPVRLSHRVHNGAMASTLRDVTFADQYLGALRTAAIGAFVNAEQDHRQIQTLLRADTFEPDGQVNELGLPVEIGDIFDFEPIDGVGDRRSFILLGQACDLSMRRNGSRSPELRTVTLLRVAKQKTAHVAKHPLGYLDSDSNDRWAVDLRPGYELVVPTDVIDATVFSSTGESVIQLGHSETRAMAQSWLMRLSILQRRAKTSIEKYRAFETQLSNTNNREEILRALAAELTCGVSRWQDGATVQIETASDTIRYGVRRRTRVRADVAARIADIAIRYRSRPAFDAEFVREREQNANVP